MKNLGRFIIIASLLILAACNQAPPPEVAPASPDILTLDFAVDPAAGTVELATPLTSQRRVLEPDVQLTATVVGTQRVSSRQFNITATFTNVSPDQTFTNFAFQNNGPGEGGYSFAPVPAVSPDDLGPDGVLSIGETTLPFTFPVFHFGRPFTYRVQVLADASDDCLFNAVVTSQADIDALQGCRFIGGNVLVTGGENLDFSGLTDLEQIQGGFRVFNNPETVTIIGPPNLSVVEADFVFVNNASLTSVAGFDALTTVSGETSTGGDFLVRDNPSLVSFPLFPSLVAANQSFGFDNNDALEAIAGFPNLTFVGGIFVITRNDALVSVGGFNSFTNGQNATVAENTVFDCSEAPQASLPFLPVRSSFGNLVDCPVF